ncbi:unnamed protein product [Chondrus crispus]|uniref:peptidyl-tRNA hydrolase n=1 Tax=Chondrus crispus TaxID=2769 RepID=R7QGU9_CHOCR|nr:unnamed protein product [Chondrus crispus]CDF36691.1 unnamed protein product [Chondrus crispus]|eukprot:XP_005716510.1 unnamed protein product [Chondrus crispus]
MWPFRRKRLPPAAAPALAEVSVRPHPSRLLRMGGRRHRSPYPSTPPKMVILVRTDLNMTTGKIAAQASHAAVRLYQTACKLGACNRWNNGGQRKLVLRVGGEKQMDDVVRRARERKLAVAVVRDEAQVKTAVSVLGEGRTVNEVTGHLKLF